MIITDIKKIEKLSKINEDANWEFRSFLKNVDLPSEEIDKIVHRLNEEISSKIDCKKCANCCKTVLPILDEEDGLTFNYTPCPFLKENLCSYYDCRPEACRSYPHLHKDDFVFRLMV